MIVQQAAGSAVQEDGFRGQRGQRSERESTERQQEVNSAEQHL